ncbi:tetraacyldisaccharide 4'-kinase [Maribacter sp. 2210JD10-5]|uniref:tetraacyldisaccharide 4'-kinase n=1 Tax=Maribacter sp. 2210JD10-5 TaxID=3386272 RepID=UPI0039BC6A5F
MPRFRKLLFPISLIYGLVVYLRNFFYDSGVFKSRSFDTPLICIGNLSVGGTGKTPMTELLIAQLKTDFKLAVLSRGYKRKSKGFMLADETSSVTDLGDEPFQMYSKFPEVTFAVDADRRNGISWLEENIYPDIILLDDAFQHRKVKPDFSILLTSYGDLYSNDWYLPTGNLRDSKNAAKRADLIIVTKCPQQLSEKEAKKIITVLKPSENQKVLFTYLNYSKVLYGSEGEHLLSEFKNSKVSLVTGIANPRPLIEYLGLNDILFEHINFPDHHFFTEKELDLLKTKERIITTEKDFVRLKTELSNLAYIPMKHAFLFDGLSMLQEKLYEFMKPRS